MIHFDLDSKKKLIEELTKLTEQEDFWKQRAADGIERCRKGDAKITVTDKNGNPIPNAKINAQVSDEEFEKRRAVHTMREPNVKSGWLYRYSKLVGPSCKGAVMNED